MQQKCPNYEKDKARDTKTTVATPSDPSIDHMIESPPDNEDTNPSSLALYILIPVAVLLLFITLIALFLRVRDRGWGALLPTISHSAQLQGFATTVGTSSFRATLRRPGLRQRTVTSDGSSWQALSLRNVLRMQKVASRREGRVVEILWEEHVEVLPGTASSVRRRRKMLRPSRRRIRTRRRTRPWRSVEPLCPPATVPHTMNSC